MKNQHCGKEARQPRHILLRIEASKMAMHNEKKMCENRISSFHP
jgi:hypothetical protein